MKKILVLFTIYLSLVNNLNSQDINYKTQLISEMKTMKLYLDKEWLLLMRYRKNFLGWKSEVDNPEYFFSKFGKTNPEMELESTIISFFDDSEYPDENKKMHPQCAFPARFSFVQKKLIINPDKIKIQTCNKFKVWKDSLDPDSLSVVFASYYLGSPASIMGHTLFKINSKQNKNKELLDYGVNYAAVTNDKNPFRYTWKGLTGGYSGIFSIYPYYVKVNEYNDMETRDLWEYELSLNKHELERFLNHLWELLWSAKFDYFFFDENCSYHMYALVEYSRLGLKLRDDFYLVVNPPESIKKYLSQEGLINSIKFRPSLYTNIEQKIDLMNEKEKDIFYDIWKEQKSIESYSLSNIRKDLILDTLLDSWRWKLQKNNQSEEDKKIYKKYLIERSLIEEDTYSLIGKEYKSYPPEKSHDFSRISVSRGISNDGAFQELKYRIGYHDILNSEKGFMPNSEVILGDVSIRYFDNNKLYIDKFVLGGLSSFNHANKLANPVSYKIDISFDSVMKKNEYGTLGRDLFLISMLNLSDSTNQMGINFYNSSLRKEYEAFKIHPFNLEGLFGKSYYYSKSSKFLFSLLSGPKLQIHNEFTNGYRWAPAIFINLTYEIQNWKFGYMGGYYHYAISQNKNDYLSNFKIRYLLSDNREIRLDWSTQAYFSEGSLGFHFLF